MSAFPALALSWALSAVFSQSGHRMWSLAQADTVESAQGSVLRVFLYWVWSIPIWNAPVVVLAFWKLPWCCVTVRKSLLMLMLWFSFLHFMSR